MFCHKCGTQLPEHSGFCHKCGEKLIKDEAVQHTPVEPVSSADLHNNNKYCVTLTNVGSRKIEVIKVVRELTGLGLAEAKELVDTAPKALKVGLTKSEAETIKSTLVNVGARATLEISDAEQIDYKKGASTKNVGCLTSVLSPFIATITVVFLLLFGLTHPVTLGGLAILLIVAIISVITTIKEKTKNPKKLIVAIAVVVIVAVVAIVVSFGSRVDYIETVKSYRPYTNWGYNQTYQQVFSHFISDLKWSYEKAGDGAEVTAQGTSPLYGNMEIVISVIPIPGENNLFTIDPMSVTAGSEKSIGPVVQLDLLGMFGAYAQGSDWDGLALPIQSAQPSQGTGTANQSAGGSSYSVEELSDLLGTSTERLSELFGSPDFGTPVDGYLYDGGEYWGYDYIIGDIIFILEYETVNIGTISINNPELLEVNGETLDKPREELIRILGEPVSEGWNDYTGDYSICFVTSCWIEFSLESPDDDVPNSISIFHA